MTLRILTGSEILRYYSDLSDMDQKAWEDVPKEENSILQTEITRGECGVSTDLSRAPFMMID